MQNTNPEFITLDDWIASEAMSFSVATPSEFHAAVAKVVASHGGALELLGFGEPLHGGEDVLQLRNQLFQRLVEAHGFSAIAIESSFPRAYMVNEFVTGRGPNSYEEVQDAGFSYGFRRLTANRELVEWMRRYNSDAAHPVKLRFYGFDSPTSMTGTDSPRQCLEFALDYLASVDPASEREHRSRIVPLLGLDAEWENPAALMDPTKAVGLSGAAAALRVATEELASTLQTRRPECVAKSDAGRYLEAAQHVTVARQLLNYHAGLARASDDRVSRLLGIRDAMMADNLTYAVARERGRGRVLAFAHNTHLQRSKAQWQLGPTVCAWWPAGSHLHEMLGPRYAVIGTAMGESAANGISRPEPGTLEARLVSAPGRVRLIPTHLGQSLPGAEIAALPTRSGSAKNPTYFPLSPRSIGDFDWLAVLDSTECNRTAPQ